MLKKYIVYYLEYWKANKKENEPFPHKTEKVNEEALLENEVHKIEMIIFSLCWPSLQKTSPQFEHILE